MTSISEDEKDVCRQRKIIPIGDLINIDHS
jgi:hypothetical protein